VSDPQRTITGMADPTPVDEFWHGVIEEAQHPIAKQRTMAVSIRRRLLGRVASNSQ